jgi:hypothetical protein
VVVRAAALSGEQAQIVGEWIERLKEPGVWWAVSRELQEPDSAPEVAQAVADHPWLTQVFPVLLEASVDGSPPPPPSPADEG